MQSCTRFRPLAAATLLCTLIGVLLACVAPAVEDNEMTTPNPRNPFARQVEARRNIDRLVIPGVQAERIGRNNLSVGIVKEDTRQITATYFVADVEVRTPYDTTSVDIPGVRFNVPVSEGDVVSLEIPGGNPLNGVYGTPIRPKGPNILTFDGPTDAAGWAADESAPAALRSRNETFQSYVLPINVGGVARVNTPLDSNVINVRILSIPDPFTILTTPAAAQVELKATLHGGLRIVGGPKAGNYPIRTASGNLQISAIHLPRSGPFIISETRTHYGFEAGRGTGADVGNYRDQLNQPLRPTGHQLLFDRTIKENPTATGGRFDLTLLADPPAYTEIEYYRPVTHPEYAHPEYTGQLGTHPMHDHPEYTFWTWDALGPPDANETYYLWLGLSDVEITIVELGTGGSR